VIRAETAGPVWTVTIDRPDKANSLTRAMLADLRDLARAAAEGPHALILTGEGRVFSAGADLDEARAPRTRCGKSCRVRWLRCPASPSRR
jgi:enoyl-CoA hydratase